jgi:hypothetical protein
LTRQRPSSDDGEAHVRWTPFSLVALTTLASLAAPPVSLGCGSHSDIQEVYTALDAAGDRKRTTFYTDSINIFCDADFATSKRGVTVRGLIRATKLDGKSRNVFIAQEEIALNAGKQTISFELKKLGAEADGVKPEDIPWPSGEFTCEIYENGQLEGTTNFKIVTPECPDGPAFVDQLCKGFYPEGALCPGAEKGSVCTCGGGGLWEGC